MRRFERVVALGCILAASSLALAAERDSVTVAAQLTSLGLRIETDLRNEKIGYKIREHSLAKFPVLLVVGKHEAKEGTVSLHRIGRNDNETLTLREAMVRRETEALRSTSSPVSLAAAPALAEGKGQLAEAAAG